MQKSIRTAALLSILSLTAVPMLLAEPMGTDPRPKGTGISLSWADVAYTVLASFGL